MRWNSCMRLCCLSVFANLSFRQYKSHKISSDSTQVSQILMICLERSSKSKGCSKNLRNSNFSQRIKWTQVPPNGRKSHIYTRKQDATTVLATASVVCSRVTRWTHNYGANVRSVMSKQVNLERRLSALNESLKWTRPISMHLKIARKYVPDFGWIIQLKLKMSLFSFVRIVVLETG